MFSEEVYDRVYSSIAIFWLYSSTLIRFNPQNKVFTRKVTSLIRFYVQVKKTSKMTLSQYWELTWFESRPVTTMEAFTFSAWYCPSLSIFGMIAVIWRRRQYLLTLEEGPSRSHHSNPLVRFAGGLYAIPHNVQCSDSFGSFRVYVHRDSCNIRHFEDKARTESFSWS